MNIDQEVFEKCNFYSGDWQSVKILLENRGYDYILTSETIYNQENYQKLLEIFNEKLKSNGLVYPFNKPQLYIFVAFAPSTVQEIPTVKLIKSKPIISLTVNQLFGSQNILFRSRRRY